MGKKGGTRRYFSKEYKLSVVKRNVDGESSGKFSKELGLDKSLICHWARAYRDKGEIGLEKTASRKPLTHLSKTEKIIRGRPVEI